MTNSNKRTTGSDMFRPLFAIEAEPRYDQKTGTRTTESGERTVALSGSEESGKSNKKKDG